MENKETYMKFERINSEEKFKGRLFPKKYRLLILKNTIRVYPHGEKRTAYWLYYNTNKKIDLNENNWIAFGNIESIIFSSYKSFLKHLDLTKGDVIIEIYEDLNNGRQKFIKIIE